MYRRIPKVYQGVGAESERNTMTMEELFLELNNQYGDDFNWYLLPATNTFFVKELKQEIGQEHFLYHEAVRAVAKCESNDNVLFVADNEDGKDNYYVFHLTYQEHNGPGFPRCKKLVGIEAVREYLE